MGQVQRVTTWQCPPRRHVSLESKEAEMLAWQFDGSCRHVVHMGHRGHRDLSGLLREVRSCLDRILLLQFIRCSTVRSEDNMKYVKAMSGIQYAGGGGEGRTRWQAVQCLLALTFSAQVRSGHWSCGCFSPGETTGVTVHLSPGKALWIFPSVLTERGTLKCYFEFL